MRDYDPHAKLSENKEGWLALGINEGGRFAQAAASELLRDCKVGYDKKLSWEVAYHMIRSAIAREDKDAVRVYVNDWTNWDGRKTALVSKFMPGEHYHVLDTKFNTLDEARRHLSREGYDYAGLKEVYVPKTEGD